MLREIIQFNNINIRWIVALVLVFFVSALLSVLGWIFYLFYWVFKRLNIFEKKSEFVS
jgi:hypothetical protein